MKSTVLLATALFLASAPTPDTNSISEMSGGFLSRGQSEPLRASESPVFQPAEQDKSIYLKAELPKDIDPDIDPDNLTGSAETEESDLNIYK